jgi:hypothetical protein
MMGRGLALFHGWGAASKTKMIVKKRQTSRQFHPKAHGLWEFPNEKFVARHRFEFSNPGNAVNFVERTELPQ